jgi:hypothetical protein
MTKDSTKVASNILLGAEWHDSIEALCTNGDPRVHRVDVGERAIERAWARPLCAASRAFSGRERTRATGNGRSRTAGIWPPQRSSRSRADGNVWEDDDIGSTRTAGDF